MPKLDANELELWNSVVYSLQTQPEKWTHDDYYIKHEATGISLRYVSGPDFYRIYVDSVPVVDPGYRPFWFLYASHRAMRRSVRNYFKQAKLGTEYLRKYSSALNVDWKYVD